jgi:hypothetical protein
MSYHGKIPLQHRHSPYNFEFDDTIARTAYVPTTTDLYKIAFQKDNKSSWVLIGVTPVEWIPLGNGSSTGGTGTTVDSSWIIFDTRVDRTAYVPTTTDLYRPAFQKDDKSSWLLDRLSPVEWIPLGNGSSTGGTGTTVDSSWIIFDTNEDKTSYVPTTTDLYRPAFVKSNEEKWLLVGLSPVIWSMIGSSTTGTGGTGDTSYVRTEPSNQNVGGVKIGDTFNGTLQDVFDAIFYPPVPPVFTSFSMTGQATTLEIGDTIPLGGKTFTWSYNAFKQVTLLQDSTKIEDATGSLVYANNIPNIPSISTQTMPADIKKVAISSHSWKIYTKTSANNTISSTFTVNWKAYSFFGISTSTVITSTDILAMTKRFQDGFVGSYAFGGGGYKWICYPKSFGNANTSKFKDTASGFGVAIDPASPITVPVTNSFGVTIDYLCYRTMNILNGTITIAIGA